MRRRITGPRRPIRAAVALGLLAAFASVSGGPPHPSETVPGTPPRETGNDRKARILRDIDVAIRKTTAPFLGEGQVAQYRQRLSALPQGAPPAQIVGLKMALADAHLAVGEVDEAIREFEECLRYFMHNPGDPRTVLHLMRRAATAYLRLGERRNCIAHRNADSCLFPLSAAGVHADREGAEKARATLLQAVGLAPGDLTATWLFNLAHMLLGSYPDGVPAENLIPPEALASEHDIGRFRDRAPELGLNAFSRSGGAAMDDFDGDGLLDVLTSSIDPGTPMRLFRNEGNGKFRDVSEAAGLLGQLGGLNFVHADFDGDGRLDVLVLRGAWMGNHGEMPNSLLRQGEYGVFRDVTLEAGIEVAAPTQTAAFADFDQDGALDLFVGYETGLVEGRLAYTSRLWRNGGDGRFEDASARAGVANEKYCKGCAFGDVDGDGFPDLYVSNLGAPNRLYRNRGDGTFAEVAAERRVHDPIYSFPVWFFDANNDGSLDLLVTHYGYEGRTDEVAASYRNGTTGLDTVRLYENDARGGFRDATAERGLRRVFFPMGSNFGDFDNDGWPDMLFGTGDPDLASLWPNVALRNDRGLRFQDVTASGGFGHLQKGHGVAFGDIDNDGDQDVFVQMGGALKDDGFFDLLLENPGHGNRWITLRLEGARSNRPAIGARVRVRIAEAGGERDVYAFVGTNSSFGGNSYQQEIGLGRAERIVSLEILWPATLATQTFGDVPLDRAYRIREGLDRPEVLDLPKIRF